MFNGKLTSLSAPFDVQFDITRLCQLDCSYCCAAPLDGKSVQTEKAISVVNELADAGVISLLLLGGEPTLHPGFMDILAESAKSMPMVSFGTNGIRLAKGSLASEIKCVAPNVLVTLSLDSIDSNCNDLNRGFGNLALQGIERCCEENVEVSISCVLSDSNIGNAHKIVDHFYPRVRHFSFFPRVPRTENEKFFDYKTFSANMAAFIAEMEMRLLKTNDLKLQLPYSSIPENECGTLMKGKSGCCCHITKAYITTDLDVYPCYYSLSDGNWLGNLGDSSFSQIWSGNLAQEVRTRGDSQCLCGMTFFEDAVPVRFKGEGAIYKTALSESSHSRCGFCASSRIA